LVDNRYEDDDTDGGGGDDDNDKPYVEVK